MTRREELIIRPAREADIPSLTGLLSILFTIEKDFQIDEARQSRGLGLLLGSQAALVLVAEAHGQVVGMCTGQLLISTASGTAKVVVEDVVVRPERQRCGIGSRLLVKLAAWAAGRGASRMQLLADRDNRPALDFYSRQGWQTTNLICLHRGT